MLRRNILIFQTGGLGDFVLTWPFAVGLGRIYPQSRIIYVTHSQKGDLAKKVLRLEATDAETGWHALFADGGKLPAAQLKLLESAQAIYTFLPVSAMWRANVLRINSSVKCVEIDARIPPDFAAHVTDQMIEQLKEYPPEKAATEQILRSVAARGIGYTSTTGSGVVIHPGAGSPAKCWPLTRFIELANELKSAGESVRFIVGEVERERWSDGDLKRLADVAAVKSCDTLIELLNEISTAEAFVGNDSGPTHLAGIVGVPTIALFGPTDPVQWKPLGPRVRMVRGEPMDHRIDVGMVLTTLRELWKIF